MGYIAECVFGIIECLVLFVGAPICLIALTKIVVVLVYTAQKYEIRMTFKQFLTIYKIAPSKWKLNETAQYRGREVYFGIVGQFRYWLWMLKHNERETKRRECQIQALRDMKKDIEKFLQDS